LARQGVCTTPAAGSNIIDAVWGGRRGLTAVLAARATLAAGAAGARDGLVHDPADGARAPAALGAAPETAVDLPGGARRSLSRKGRANVVVGQHVARTDDHGNPAVPARLVHYATIDT